MTNFLAAELKSTNLEYMQMLWVTSSLVGIVRNIYNIKVIYYI